MSARCRGAGPAPTGRTSATRAGWAGCRRRRSLPRLNGRKWCLVPGELGGHLRPRRWTPRSAPAPGSPKPSSGSLRSGSGGRSACTARSRRSMDWVKSVFSSSVATGRPLTKNTRSMLFCVRRRVVHLPHHPQPHRGVVAPCVVGLRVVAGRNWHIENVAASCLKPLRSTFSVPPPASSGGPAPSPAGRAAARVPSPARLAHRRA